MSDVSYVDYVMSTTCEECGRQIDKGDIWICACGKRLCGSCYIRPPHSTHQSIYNPKGK